MIQCPNYSCQASNAEAHQFCHQCQAPLPRRFLWAVGHRAGDFSAGMLISDRYLCKAPQIFLDTKPGLPPGTLSDIPSPVLPYLRLTPHRLYLPQVYGWADGTLDSGDVVRLMFLENPAVQMTPSDATDLHADTQASPQLLPPLHVKWPSASAFQQLHWLWQIAQLWQPLSNEHIASTLLSDHLIRVEGSLIRLLQLHSPNIRNTQARPTLSQLGEHWESLVPNALPDLRDFLQQLCQHMRDGKIQDSLDLVQILDAGIQAIGQSHDLHIGIATQTDKGPSRANNQDACFPDSGQLVHYSSKAHPTSVGNGTIEPLPESPHKSQLVVVCDGIGGHQGGEVASAIAIEQLTHSLNPDPLEQSTQHLDPWSIHAQLDQAIATANDAINEQNDAEQRRDRERMGTTVVLGVVHDHTCYLANVGDSRAYWITKTGCHQITLDDDVASREARLGYGTYRSVLYHPNAGALVQALGMGPSEKLYPSGQRLILGGEGILLFCSDGLSDQDLIETSWQSIFLPLFQPVEENSTYLDLDSVAQSLIDLANTRNGHDNVTVGLVQWQSQPTQPIQLPEVKTLVDQITKNISAAANLQPQGTPQVSNTTLPSLAELLDSSDSATSTTAASSNPATSHPQEQGQRTAFPNSIFDEASSDSHAVPSGEPQTSDSTSAPIPQSREAIDEDSTIWLSPKSKTERKSPLLALITTLFSVGGILILAGALVYIWVPSVSDRINAALGITDTIPPKNPRETQPDTDSRTPEERDNSLSNPENALNNETLGIDGENLVIGNILNVRTSAPRILSISGDNPAQSVPPNSDIPIPPAETAELVLFKTPPNNSNESDAGLTLQTVGVVPWGSTLKVQSTLQLSEDVAPSIDDSSTTKEPTPETINRETSTGALEPTASEFTPDSLAMPNRSSVIPAPERWIQVQLCFSPEEALDDQPNRLNAGSIGWTSERQLKELSYVDTSPASPNGEHCSSLP